MNLTISVDDGLLAQARSVARQRGTSVQALIRDYLRGLVGEVPVDEAADELARLFREQSGQSGGRRIGRDEAYEERT